jgi:hypothetical protein
LLNWVENEVLMLHLNQPYLISSICQQKWNWYTSTIAIGKELKSFNVRTDAQIELN